MLCLWPRSLARELLRAGKHLIEGGEYPLITRSRMRAVRPL